MKNIKRFEELNEEMYAGQGPNDNIIEQPMYTEQELRHILEDMAAELIYSFDDYGRGYDFAQNEAEKEADKYIEKYKK